MDSSIVHTYKKGSYTSALQELETSLIKMHENKNAPSEEISSHCVANNP